MDRREFLLKVTASAALLSHAREMYAAFEQSESPARNSAPADASGKRFAHSLF